MDWSRIKYFTHEELACRCGCERSDMDQDFMEKLDRIRAEGGAPLHISSGFRCPEYNNLVSSTGIDGPHTTGRAVDIRCSGGKATRLVKAAVKHGIARYGVSQKGAHASRFIHLDDVSEEWIWSY